PVAPTTAEQRLARKNELKAHGTLLMALPDKHQLKFNSHKDAKTLMEAIKKRTNEPVSAAPSVSAVCAKMPVSSLLNVDSLSNVVIYSFFASQSSSPQLDNDDLKQIDADDLEEMDLKWQMAMKGHFAREYRSPKDTRRNGAAEPQMRNVPIETTTSNALVSQCDGVGSYDWRSDESLPPSPIYDRYQSRNGYHDVPSPYTGTFMPPKPDLVFNNAPTDVETDHSAFNVKLSPTKPTNDFSLTNRPLSTEQVKSPRSSVQHFETSIPAATPTPASLKPTSNGKRRNRKACFMCKSLDHLIKDCDNHEKKMAKPAARDHAHRGYHKQYALMTLHNPQRHMVPATVLTQSKPVPITVVRPDKGVIDSGCSRHMTGNMSYLSDFEEFNGGYVAFEGNPKGGKISEKGNLVRGLPTKVFANDNTCVACKKGKQHKASCKTKPVSSINLPLYRLHMDLFGPTFVKSLNKKSYCLGVTDDYSRFTWVFFLATKDETSPILKTFITGLENQLSLKVKVIRSDNGTKFKNHDLNQFCRMKGIKREFSVPRTPQQNGSGPTWLFDIDTLTKTMNYQPVTADNQSNPNAGVQENFNAEKVEDEIDQQYVIFPVWSFGFTNPQNTDGDAVFDEKKLESEVNVSPSSKFEDFSDNSINEVNAAGTLVPTVGQISPNIINTFSVATPSNVAASPTHGKSSCIDASQLPDDPDMPELEDITYSDDEDDVGAEVDFNNLETSITISPIPITRVHKYHPVTQIIGDLSSATQTRSMTRVAKDQGGQMEN
nr:putative ribonuclease H-like domain-containing protein [Tanacetum cinerariifolium]